MSGRLLGSQCCQLTLGKMFNAMAIGTSRLIQNGVIPSYAADPYHTDWMTNFWKYMSPRDEFLDFQLMLKNKYKPVEIRWIKMREKITDHLDYTSKLERDAAFIKSLVDEGEKQAGAFLK